MGLEVLGVDGELVELRVRASNGRVAGTADCYDGHDAISRLIVAVRGFPSSPEDRRAWEVGTFDEACAGGGARIVLRCTDRAGHGVADITVRGDPQAAASPETASFSLPVAAADIDAFVAALETMRLAVGATAGLRPVS